MTLLWSSGGNSDVNINDGSKTSIIGFFTGKSRKSNQVAQKSCSVTVGDKTSMSTATNNNCKSYYNTSPNVRPTEHERNIVGNDKIKRNKIQINNNNSPDRKRNSKKIQRLSKKLGFPVCKGQSKKTYASTNTRSKSDESIVIINVPCSNAAYQKHQLKGERISNTTKTSLRSKSLFDYRFNNFDSVTFEELTIADIDVPSSKSIAFNEYDYVYATFGENEYDRSRSLSESEETTTFAFNEIVRELNLFKTTEMD
eukprot:Awhi_evm1s10520